MNSQLFTKWSAKYFLIGLCCVLLLIVPLLRGPWIGTESFLYARLAEDPSWFDALSFGGRFAAYPWGTPLTLSIAPGTLIEILPFVLGILSFLLFRKILQRFTDDHVIVSLSSLFLILSPTFLYTFSFTNSLFIATFLALVAFALFLSPKWKWYAVPIVIILPMFNIVLTSALLLALFFLSFSIEKKQKKFFLVLLVITLLAAGGYYGYMISQTGFPHSFVPEESRAFEVFQQFFFDLGAPYGLGIFLALLGAIGAWRLWDKKYTNLFVFFSVTFFLLFSFFRSENLVFLNFFLVFLAAYGFRHLTQITWSDNTYRFMVFLIIVSGTVFSAVSQIDQLTDAPPTPAMMEGLVFISQLEPGVVFTDYTRGVWVNSAGHENVMDENVLFVPDVATRWNDTTALYYSRDFEVTEALFTTYNVSYVWIDEEMKEKIWSYDTEGLLFILQYTSGFNKIYDKNGVEIWRVRYD